MFIDDENNEGSDENVNCFSDDSDHKSFWSDLQMRWAARIKILCPEEVWPLCKTIKCNRSQIANYWLNYRLMVCCLGQWSGGAHPSPELISRTALSWVSESAALLQSTASQIQQHSLQECVQRIAIFISLLRWKHWLYYLTSFFSINKSTEVKHVFAVSSLLQGNSQ